MIDWTGFTLPLLHDPLRGGHVVSVDRDGVEEWNCPKSVRAEGSYSSSVQLRSVGGNGEGMATGLSISGNPSKFLQGHNIYGSEDLRALLGEFVGRICQPFGLPAEYASRVAMRGDFDITRLDVARSFCAGSLDRARAIQSALALKSRTRQGRCQTHGGTNYWNLSKRKQYWLCKSYIKGEELTSSKKHHLPQELPSREDLLMACQSYVRIEFEFFRKELEKQGCLKACDLTPEVIDRLYCEYMGKIEMNPQTNIPSEEILHLPRCIRDTYLLWKSGVDVRVGLPRTSFYRHRSELLGYGVDIALPNDGEASNVIPLFVTIQAQPVEVPQWVKDRGLIFQPT